MNWFSRIFHSRQIDADLSAELRSHLDEKIDSLVASGIPRREAELAARRQLGNATLLEEQGREVWRWTLLENLATDVRFALRMLRKNPGFTAVAVLTLALGIGANTAMYMIIRGAFSWDMGLQHRERIVLISSDDVARGRELEASYPDFLDFRAQTKSLADIAAYDMVPVNVSDGSALPERYFDVRMSANGFDTIQQSPLLGRAFVQADESPNAPPVVVLGYHVWRDRYASDPGVLGKTVRIDEISHVIVGVMPPNRRFPEDTDLWTPLRPDAARQRRENRSLLLFGRLRGGVLISAVRAEFDSIAHSLAAQYPDSDAGLSVTVQPIDYITGLYRMRPLLLVLFAAVGFVLLIACANVANMLLVRAAYRSREISVRIALGAGKAAILRQLLVESSILALLGGLFGCFVAVAGVRWFNSGLDGLEKPFWLQISLDRGAFVYVVAIALATGALFGLAPALRLANTTLNAAIKESGGVGATRGKFSWRLSNTLLAIQVTLCLVLLVGAGLLIRSAINLYGTPTGVNPSNILTMRINLPKAKYLTPENWIAFHDGLLPRLASIPGVRAVGLASNLPFGGWISSPFELEGETSDANHRRSVGSLVVSNDYFDLMEISPRQGRAFSAVDGHSGSLVSVVNEAFAARFWPGEDVIGKRLRVFDDNSAGPWLTVVGLVPDVLQNNRDSLRHDPLIYLPFAERPLRQVFIVARTTVPSDTVTPAFRRAVQGIDPNLPVYDVLTLATRFAQTRLGATLFGAICGVFAAIAIVLATIGLYSVIAYSVARRTVEIGVRTALGATPGHIARLVIAKSLLPVLLGAAAGLLGAAAVSRVLQSVLYGLSPHDPITFAIALACVAMASLAGCAIPVRRAAAIDPIVALRHE
jgi:putative ABC transport system permease protein